MSGSIALVQPINDYKPGALCADVQDPLEHFVSRTFNKHTVTVQIVENKFLFRSLLHPNETPIAVDPDSFPTLQNRRDRWSVASSVFAQYVSANGEAERVATDGVFQMLDAGACVKVPGGNAYNFMSNVLSFSRGLPPRLRSQFRVILPEDGASIEHFQQFPQDVVSVLSDTRLQLRRSLHMPAGKVNAMLSTVGLSKTEQSEILARHLNGHADTERVLAAAHPPSDRPGALVLPSSPALQTLSQDDLRAHQCMLNDEEFRKALQNSGLAIPRVLREGQEEVLRNFSQMPEGDREELIQLMVQLFDNAASRSARPAPDSPEEYTRLLSVGTGPAGCMSVYRTRGGLELTFATSVPKERMKTVLFLLSDRDAGNFEHCDLTGRGDACAAAQYIADVLPLDPSLQSHTPANRRLLKMWRADTLGRIAPTLVSQTRQSNLWQLDASSARTILECPSNALHRIGSQVNFVELPDLFGIHLSHMRLSDDQQS